MIESYEPLERVLRADWLSKRPLHPLRRALPLSGWRRRWIELTPSSLRWRDAPGERAKGSLNLCAAKAIPIADESHGQPSAELHVTDEESGLTLPLRARSAEEARLWYELLVSAIREAKAVFSSHSGPSYSPFSGSTGTFASPSRSSPHSSHHGARRHGPHPAAHPQTAAQAFEDALAAVIEGSSLACEEERLHPAEGDDDVESQKDAAYTPKESCKPDIAPRQLDFRGALGPASSCSDVVSCAHHGAASELYRASDVTMTTVAAIDEGDVVARLSAPHTKNGENFAESNDLISGLDLSAIDWRAVAAAATASSAGSSPLCHDAYRDEAPLLSLSGVRHAGPATSSESSPRAHLLHGALMRPAATFGSAGSVGSNSCLFHLEPSVSDDPTLVSCTTSALRAAPEETPAISRRRSPPELECASPRSGPVVARKENQGPLGGHPDDRQLPLSRTSYDAPPASSTPPNISIMKVGGVPLTQRLSQHAEMGTVCYAASQDGCEALELATPTCNVSGDGAQCTDAVGDGSTSWVRSSMAGCLRGHVDIGVGAVLRSEPNSASSSVRCGCDSTPGPHVSPLVYASAPGAAASDSQLQSGVRFVMSASSDSCGSGGGESGHSADVSASTSMDSSSGASMACIVEAAVSEVDRGRHPWQPVSGAAGSVAEAERLGSSVLRDNVEHAAAQLSHAGLSAPTVGSACDSAAPDECPPICVSYPDLAASDSIHSCASSSSIACYTAGLPLALPPLVPKTFKPISSSPPPPTASYRSPLPAEWTLLSAAVALETTGGPRVMLAWPDSARLSRGVAGLTVRLTWEEGRGAASGLPPATQVWERTPPYVPLHTSQSAAFPGGSSGAVSLGSSTATSRGSSHAASPMNSPLSTRLPSGFSPYGQKHQLSPLLPTRQLSPLLLPNRQHSIGGSSPRTSPQLGTIPETKRDDGSTSEEEDASDRQDTLQRPAGKNSSLAGDGGVLDGASNALPGASPAAIVLDGSVAFGSSPVKAPAAALHVPLGDGETGSAGGWASCNLCRPSSKSWEHAPVSRGLSQSSFASVNLPMSLMEASNIGAVAKAGAPKSAAQHVACPPATTSGKCHADALRSAIAQSCRESVPLGPSPNESHDVAIGRHGSSTPLACGGDTLVDGGMRHATCATASVTHATVAETHAGAPHATRPPDNSPESTEMETISPILTSRDREGARLSLASSFGEATSRLLDPPAMLLQKNCVVVDFAAEMGAAEVQKQSAMNVAATTGRVPQLEPFVPASALPPHHAGTTLTKAVQLDGQVDDARRQVAQAIASACARRSVVAASQAAMRAKAPAVPDYATRASLTASLGCGRIGDETVNAATVAPAPVNAAAFGGCPYEPLNAALRLISKSFKRAAFLEDGGQHKAAAEHIAQALEEFTLSAMSIIQTRKAPEKVGVERGQRGPYEVHPVSVVQYASSGDAATISNHRNPGGVESIPASIALATHITPMSYASLVTSGRKLSGGTQTATESEVSRRKHLATNEAVRGFFGVVDRRCLAPLVTWLRLCGDVRRRTTGTSTMQPSHQQLVTPLASRPSLGRMNTSESLHDAERVCSSCHRSTEKSPRAQTAPTPQPSRGESSVITDEEIAW